MKETRRRKRSNEAPQPAPKRSFGLLAVAVAVLVLVGVWVAVRRPDHSVAEAESALREGEYAAAQRQAEDLLQAEPESIDALMLAGRAAMAQQNRELALSCFRKVADDGTRHALEALVSCGELSLQLGRMTDAENFFQLALERSPENVKANEGLIYLLRLQGRNWDAQPHVLEMFRQRRFAFDYLSLAGSLEIAWINRERDVPYLEYCNKALPNDPICLLGPIRMQVAHPDNLDKVKQALFQIIASRPLLSEAQASLGKVLFERGTREDFLAWHANLPSVIDQHPLIWFVRGRWAHSQGDTRGAIRCLWEAIRLNPNDRPANLLLANLLVSIDMRQEAARFQKRGDDLLVFDDLLMRGETRTPDAAKKIVVALEQLGRLWEARGWSEFVMQVEPDSQFALAANARLEQQLQPALPLTLAAANPANAIDLSSFPLPVIPKTDQPAAAEVAAGGTSVIAFADVAGQVGLDFTYFRDRQRLRERVYTLDFAGGGVGVLDYDQDGWPDLFLTQSSAWPPNALAPAHKDRLFRNRQGQSYEDVTEFAGVGDFRFSHGVAVGDVDSDGFPDVYVANIGANGLYLNNGDGTYSPAPHDDVSAVDDYSLSAVFVDLNQDGYPDLYVANYLGGDSLTRQCRGDGKPIQCAPQDFPGQQDRLYLNLGNGRFRDVTDESGILDADETGKGMGVIAADFDGAGGLDVYVTNDSTANFLFVNKTEPGSQTLRLVEQGRVAGTAYDDLGRLQASMGIAAQDVNRDTMIDLFVTNFHREPNNLFVQLEKQPSPLFNDQALETNLSAPSVNTMGWGAQFLDAELDGDWDLVVATGNLDVNTAGPFPAEMQAQLFENEGGGRFHEVPAAKLGPYFQSKRFGRAVARLDWNRDGLEDVCTTHMDAPISLLQNTSQRRGHFAAIQLRGVSSNRDATGAVIHLKAGDEEWTVQVVAGGGFAATNQSQLVVGLGDCERIDTLTIRWPAGAEQVFREIAVDREWLFVEGLARPYLLP